MTVDAKRLRELEPAATPGPWEIVREELDAIFSDEDQECAFPEQVGPLWLAPGMSDDTPDQIEADVALVIAARNALPALLDALDRLDALEAVAEAARFLPPAWEASPFGAVPRERVLSLMEALRALDAKACAR